MSYEFLGLETLWPAFKDIYFNLSFLRGMSNNFLLGIEYLKLDNTKYYIDSYSNCKNIAFLDSNYWNPIRYRKEYLINDHIIWNLNQQPANFNEKPFWLQLYPVDISDNLVLVKDSPYFIIKYFNIDNKSYIQDFIDIKLLKHHDYQNNVYLGKNSIMQTFNAYKNFKGFYLYWYEPFGSVEISLKSFWFYWYSLFYPEFENFLSFYNNSNLEFLQNIYNDKIYINKVMTIIKSK